MNRLQWAPGDGRGVIHCTSSAGIMKLLEHPSSNCNGTVDDGIHLLHVHFPVFKRVSKVSAGSIASGLTAPLFWLA